MNALSIYYLMIFSLSTSAQSVEQIRERIQSINLRPSEISNSDADELALDAATRARIESYQDRTQFEIQAVTTESARRETLLQGRQERLDLYHRIVDLLEERDARLEEEIERTRNEEQRVLQSCRSEISSQPSYRVIFSQLAKLHTFFTRYEQFHNELRRFVHLARVPHGEHSYGILNRVDGRLRRAVRQAVESVFPDMDDQFEIRSRRRLDGNGVHWKVELSFERASETTIADHEIFSEPSSIVIHYILEEGDQSLGYTRLSSSQPSFHWNRRIVALRDTRDGQRFVIGLEGVEGGVTSFDRYPESLIGAIIPSCEQLRGQESLMSFLELQRHQIQPEIRRMESDIQVLNEVGFDSENRFLNHRMHALFLLSSQVSVHAIPGKGILFTGRDPLFGLDQVILPNITIVGGVRSIPAEEAHPVAYAREQCRKIMATVVSREDQNREIFEALRDLGVEERVAPAAFEGYREGRPLVYQCVRVNQRVVHD